MNKLLNTYKKMLVKEEVIRLEQDLVNKLVQQNVDKNDRNKKNL